MRAKFDFVTNSSSTSYILALKNSDIVWLSELVKRLESENPETNEGIGIGDEYATIEDLQEYVNGGPFDWVSKCTGLKYDYMSKPTYLECKERIECGDTIVFVYVDHDLTEEFERHLDHSVIISSDG